MEKYPACISEISSNEKKEGWHYLAVKNLSALLRGIA